MRGSETSKLQNQCRINCKTESSCLVAKLEKALLEVPHFQHLQPSRPVCPRCVLSQLCVFLITVHVTPSVLTFSIWAVKIWIWTRHCSQTCQLLVSFTLWKDFFEVFLLSISVIMFGSTFFKAYISLREVVVHYLYCCQCNSCTSSSTVLRLRVKFPAHSLKVVLFDKFLEFHMVTKSCLRLAWQCLRYLLDTSHSCWLSLRWHPVGMFYFLPPLLYSTDLEVLVKDSSVLNSLFPGYTDMMNMLSSAASV